MELVKVTPPLKVEIFPFNYHLDVMWIELVSLKSYLIYTENNFYVKKIKSKNLCPVIVLNNIKFVGPQKYFTLQKKNKSLILKCETKS